MYYYYTLSKEDIIALGLEPTNSEEYVIAQSGWTGEFDCLVEIINIPRYGKFEGLPLIQGSELTDEQKDYIIRNCKCTERY